MTSQFEFVAQGGLWPFSFHIHQKMSSMTYYLDSRELLWVAISFDALKWKTTFSQYQRSNALARFHTDISQLLMDGSVKKSACAASKFKILKWLYTVWCKVVKCLCIDLYWISHPVILWGSLIDQIKVAREEKYAQNMFLAYISIISFPKCSIHKCPIGK